MKIPQRLRGSRIIPISTHLAIFAKWYGLGSAVDPNRCGNKETGRQNSNPFFLF